MTKIGKNKIQISKYKIQKNFKVQILKGNDAFLRVTNALYCCTRCNRARNRAHAGGNP